MKNANLLNEIHLSAAFLRLKHLFAEPGTKEFAALMDVAQAQMRSLALTGRSLVNVLCAVLGMQCTPSAEWMAAFWAASAAPGVRLSARDLGDAFYALGELHASPPEEWRLYVWEALRGRTSELELPYLCNILKGSARMLDFRVPQWWALEFWNSAVERKKEFSLDLMIGVFKEYSKIGPYVKVSPPQEWMACLWAALEASPARSDKWSLVHALFACAKQKLPVPDVLWARVWALRSADLAPKLHCQALWAAATTEVQPPAAWAASFWEVTKGRLRGVSWITLTGVLWACAKLRLAPPAAWLEGAHGYWAVSASRLRGFKTLHLGCTMWACAQLGATPPPAWF